MRCARSEAWSSTAGFHHGIVVDHRVGRGQVQPAPARLQTDQEQRHFPASNAPHRLARGPACRRAARRTVCRPRRARGFIRSSIEVNCENSRMRRPSAIISPTISSRVVELARRSDQPRRWQLHQPRIAADLPQLQQRVEHDDMALREAACGDLLAHLLMQRGADGLVQFALLRRRA